MFRINLFQTRIIWMVSVLTLAGVLWACRDRSQSMPARLAKSDASAEARQEDGTAAASNENGGRSTSDGHVTLIALNHVTDRQRQEHLLLDPAQDGWDSEEFAELAKHQLEEMFSAVFDRDSLVGDLRPLCTPSAIGVGLRGELEEVFADGQTKVFRPASESSAEAPLADALRAMAAPLLSTAADEGVRFHVKIVQVNLDDRTRSTLALYEAFSQGKRQSLQQSARLWCEWASDDDKPPRIERLACEEFEETQRSAPTGKWFADCTQSILGDDPSFSTQLAYGLNHWMQRVERSHFMDDSVRNGLAVGDANGDGLDDVYCCQGPGLPNRLLVQLPDGTVRDVSAEMGVDWLDQTSSALFLDLDNDGDQDLAIATAGGLLIMENSANGRYSLRAQLGERRCDPQSLAAADYDGDGDVDLFLCIYRPSRGGRRGDFVFHDATTGGPNKLFRNDIAESSWRFADVTADVGLGVGATRYSLAAAWADYDNDNDPDLYVANDYGRNYLYENEQGHFRDVTSQTGLADTGFGMSVSWGDSNRDGRLDLYIGNMFSSAGSRVTRQPEFQRNASPEQRALYQRMAKGNSLFQQQADGRFLDVSHQAGVEMGRWAWSSVFADLNNDGWQDLLVGNGYITTEDTGDL